jgi:hypothetical protein
MTRADKTRNTDTITSSEHDAFDDLTTEIDDVTAGTSTSLAGVIRARLAVSQPSDPHEVEAERFAADFVSSTHGRSGHISQPAPGALARRADGDGLATDAAGGLATTDDTARAINAAGGGGSGLPDSVRSNFEGFFGADLSGVRVHADGQADHLCRSIEAQAFTKGNDVYFASGQYAPGTANGDHLLAHELTHVVQQGAPAISRVWSLDPRKWGKTKEQIEEEKKKKFEATMDEKVAEQASGMYSHEDENLTKTNEEAGRLESDAGYLTDTVVGGGLGTYSSANTAAKIGEGKINNLGLDTTTKVDGAAIGQTAAVGTVTLILAIKDLWQTWDDSTDGERGEKAVAVLESALSTCEGAVRIAAAGGTAAAQAVPGIGLALTVIDLAKRLSRIYYLQQAARRASDSKVGEDADSDLAISLDTVGALAKRQRNLELAQVAGDLIIVVGQIAMLSGVGSPWGAIVAVSGMFAKVATTFVGQVLRWAEAAKVQAARDDTANAAEALKSASTDEERQRAQEQLTAARKKQLAVDGWAAATQVLEKASTLDEKGKPVAKMVKLLAPFGIKEDWIIKYNEAGKPPAMFEQAATSIVTMIGTSKDPLTFVQTLKSIGAAIKAIWAKVVSVFGGGEDLDVLTKPTRIMAKTQEEVSPIVATTVAKLAKKGDISGFRIPDAVEDALRKPFAKLKGLFAPQTATGTKYESQAKTNTGLICEGIANVLKMHPMPEGVSMDGYTEDGDIEATIRSAA